MESKGTINKSDALKFINKAISNQVLVVGVKKDTPGGMASVVKAYDDYFDEMKYVTTWRLGNKFIKFQYAFIAILRFLTFMVFDLNIKIVHIHGAANASMSRKSIFIKLGKFFKKKVIMHMHAADFEEYFLEKANKRKVLNWLNSCDLLLVLSESWKKYFSSIGIDETKIEVLNNIVAHPTKQASHERDTRLRLLFMGEIGRRKGIYDLLKVLSDNRDYFKDKLLLRIGGNLEEDIISNYIIDHKLSDFVSFEGWIKNEEKIRCLNWEDVYILPSYNEGLPISILEAMSYSHPVITTNVGGIPEIVKSHYNGILIEPGNEKHIMDALIFFIENPIKISEYGFNAFKSVQSFFPEDVFSNLNKIYDRMLIQHKVFM